MRTLLLATSLAIAVIWAFAGESDPLLVNIAKGAGYTLTPAPRYEHCTDPGDATQLTDGVYTEGHFWTQASTVGWSGCTPVIMLDLGKVQAIRGVSYSTAAGVAGVQWPEKITLLTAGEDKQLHEIGDLAAISNKRSTPNAEGYRLHRFQTDELKTWGRYIALVVQAEPFIFVDEIEVYAGEPAWLDTPLPAPGYADVNAFHDQTRIREGVRRRIKRDIGAVTKDTLSASISKRIRKHILKELEHVTEAVETLTLQPGNDFRTILPLNPLHAQVFRAQARLWKAQGNPPLVLWQNNPWDPLPLTGNPPKTGTPRIGMHMMANEYRSGAFNISNTQQDDIQLHLRFTGLPGGDAPAYITVHEVLWTDTRDGKPVAAALPEAAKANDGYHISVPSGITRQVWFTFHPVDIEATAYTGSIEISGGGANLQVPILLKVYPLRFPDTPRLHMGGWDYTDRPKMYEVTPENKEAFIRHLREHFVDSPWATGAVLPPGAYDATGAMTVPPDTSAFDAWVKLWPGAAQYCVFPSVGGKFTSFPMNTPAFESAVKAWSVFWAEHARTMEVQPEQLALLLVDEPREQEQDAVILAWAKVIRAANTGIRVWEDPIYHDMSKALPDMLAACHVLCPNRQIFLAADDAYRNVFAQYRDQGTTLEFYSCSGPARLLDPYRYYRLQPWHCWIYGAKASYFWAFGDGGGTSSWNEYLLPRSAYTPLFLDATTVTPGKQMEACREGLEDYEYLAMLQDAIQTASGKGITGEPLDRAKAVLNELPGKVCAVSANISWMHEGDDRSLADGARKQILECLTQLWQP